MGNKKRHYPEEFIQYYQNTDPMLQNFTAPIPAMHLPRESWSRRAWRAVRNFFVALVRKISQLLGLALVVILLILFAHFLLTLFGVTNSLFVQWISLLGNMLLLPFANLSPPLTYIGYTIDVSTLIAILVYALATVLLRQFLRLLVARPY